MCAQRRLRTGSLLCAEAGRRHLLLVAASQVSISVHIPGRGSVVIETVVPVRRRWSWLYLPTVGLRRAAMDDVGCIAIDGACLRVKPD